MADLEPLSQEEITDALSGLDGWTFEADAITRSFSFSDFRAAVSFIVRLSYYAEEYNHHPELHNVYNSVTVTLTTHDAGNKVTGMDVALAREINGFSWV